MRDTRALFEEIQKDYKDANIFNVFIFYNPAIDEYTCQAWLLEDGPTDIDFYVDRVIESLPTLPPQNIPPSEQKPKPLRPIKVPKPHHAPIKE